jgi:hypothetical protein
LLSGGGTYKGGLEDIASTAAIAKQVTVTEILIHRIAGEEMVEGWIEFDELGLWQQLGVIPSMGEGRY